MSQAGEIVQTLTQEISIETGHPELARAFPYIFIWDAPLATMAQHNIAKTGGCGRGKAFITTEAPEMAFWQSQSSRVGKTASQGALSISYFSQLWCPFFFFFL